MTVSESTWTKLTMIIDVTSIHHSTTITCISYVLEKARGVVVVRYSLPKCLYTFLNFHVHMKLLMC